MRIKIPIFKHNTEMVTDGWTFIKFLVSPVLNSPEQIRILNSIFRDLKLKFKQFPFKESLPMNYFLSDLRTQTGFLRQIL